MGGIITSAERKDVAVLVKSSAGVGVVSCVTTILGSGSSMGESLPTNTSSIRTKNAWTSWWLAIALSKCARWACARLRLAWYLSHWPSRPPPAWKQVPTVWPQNWQLEQRRDDQAVVFVTAEIDETDEETLLDCAGGTCTTGWKDCWGIGSWNCGTIMRVDIQGFIGYTEKTHDIVIMDRINLSHSFTLKHLERNGGWELNEECLYDLTHTERIMSTT